MRCCSSLIQHKTKPAKRQSGQFSAVLLEVPCRRVLWVSGAMQSWEAGAEAEESSRIGRAGVGPPSMATGYQRYPTLLGCTPESSRARMSNAAPAHQPPQRCGQLNTCLEKPLFQRLFRLARFKMFVSKISLSYRRAISTCFLIQNRTICQALPFLNHCY